VISLRIDSRTIKSGISRAIDHLIATRWRFICICI
jgi:hypothetical protein